MITSDRKRIVYPYESAPDHWVLYNGLPKASSLVLHSGIPRRFRSRATQTRAKYVLRACLRRRCESTASRREREMGKKKKRRGRRTEEKYRPGKLFLESDPRRFLFSAKHERPTNVAGKEVCKYGMSCNHPIRNFCLAFRTLVKLSSHEKQRRH